MKKIFTLLALVSCMLCLPRSADAQWIAGGEISLTCIGGNDYIVRLVLYRDCSGINAPNVVALGFSCGSDPTQSFTLSNVTRIPGTGQEITAVCPSSISNCSGSSPIPGVQEVIFEAQVVLPPCYFWTVSWSTCCRPPSNTIFNATSSNFHIMATIDNLTVPCVSTPAFTNKPVQTICIGQTTNINFGAIDPDGDSLSYSLANPLANNTTSLSWQLGFSATQPITSNPPVTINPLTGDITLSPTMSLASTMVLKVDKYRNINGVPVFIGSSRRDIKLFIFSCINRLPVLSGMDPTLTAGYDPLDTVYYKDVCLGDTVSFAIWGYDQDTFNLTGTGSPEKFSISWNNGIPQASMLFFNQNSDSAYALFSWVPQAAVKGLNCFTATINDYACTYNGINTYSYCFFVRALDITVTPDTGVCKGESVTFHAFSDSLAANYLWRIDGTPVSPPSPSNTLIVNTSAMSDGLYLISAETEFGNPGSLCTAKATATLTVYPSPQISLGNDTSVSPEVILLLDAGPGYSSYLWSTGNVMQTLGVDSSGIGLGIKTIWVEVTNSQGCKNRDTILINFVHNPGLEELPGITGLKLFPNPSDGNLNLVLNNFSPGSYEVRIYAQDGRIVYRSLADVYEDDELIRLNVNNLPGGFYFLDLSGPGGTARSKIIVTR